LGRIKTEACLIIVDDSPAIHSGIAFNLSKEVVPDGSDLWWHAQGTDVDAEIQNLSRGKPQPFQFPFRVTAMDVFVIGHFSILLQMNHLHRA
jgi:hypothetical protein